MDWYWAVLLYVALGGLIGFMGAMVGIGGGLIAIPVLVLVFDMPQQLAQGTCLVMIVSNVLLSLRGYHRHHKIDFKSVLVAVVINMVCTNLASLVAQGLDPILLRHGFALFLFLVASFYLYQTLPKKNKNISKNTKQQTQSKQLGLGGFIYLGILSGIVGGLFGVGGSLMVVPVLTTIYGYKQIIAQSIGLAMIVPGLCIALATYAWHGNTDWLVGGALALGGFFMVRHGVALAIRLPELVLKRTFSVVLFLTVLLLVFK